MEGLQTTPQYITTSITNTGIMPFRIPAFFLYFKIPFQWGIIHAVTPLDLFKGDPYIPQRSYPVEIQPRTNMQFYMGTPELQKKEMIETWKKYRWWMYFLRRFIRFKLQTEDGRKFSVKMSKDIRRMMIQKPD